MIDFVEKQYWIVLLYQHVKDLPNLRISPLGVVPQRERRPRLIVDYTFSGVNPETKRMAHPEAMQFGRALQRVLGAILDAPPEHGPCYLIKIDLSDGFYRVPVRSEDVPTLGVVLPSEQPTENPWIAFPLVLPMGWRESPPHFTSLTETITDLANQWIDVWDPPLHPLEAAASSPPDVSMPTPCIIVPPPKVTTTTRLAAPPFPPAGPFRTTKRRRRKRRKPTLHVDVYVDDEIAVAQGSPPKLNRLRRGLLHINDSVFRPNDNQDPQSRREPISIKKLRKGDACWSTFKTILGWDVDTIQKTIQLPPHRRDRLLTILAEVRGRRRIGVKAMHRFLGELRSMAPGLPGGRGLFSQLQHSLSHASDNRVRLHAAARDHIEDLWLLANALATRPTKIAEVVPQLPAYLGACDAAKAGMGGVLLPPTSPTLHQPAHPPLVWRTPFPLDIQQRVVGDNNPTGTITNSDLELAGTIAHADVAVTNVECRERTLATACDNMAAVSWQRKGSVTTTGSAAYLLRENSIHQREHRYCHVVRHLAGTSNTMADDASRRFDLDDSQFLHYFNTTYPQSTSWQLCPLSTELNSKLICALQQQRPDRPSLEVVPQPPPTTGPSTGCPSSKALAWTPTSVPSQIQSPSSWCSPPECATAAPPLTANRFVLEQLLNTYTRSQRASPTWGPQTPG